MLIPTPTPTQLASANSRATKKRITANKFSKYASNWRELLWRRLVEVNSPWLDFAALMSIGGMHLNEIEHTTFKRQGDCLELIVLGVNIGLTKGQQSRTLLFSNDGSPEFAHLFSKSTETHQTPLLLSVSKDYTTAFSAALARAGKKVFPKSLPDMTGLVYRHAFASDLKAERVHRDVLATALGQCVSKATCRWGWSTSGIARNHLVSAVATRPIKQTHAAEYPLNRYGNSGKMRAG